MREFIISESNLGTLLRVAGKVAEEQGLRQRVPLTDEFLDQLVGLGIITEVCVDGQGE